MPSILSFCGTTCTSFKENIVNLFIQKQSDKRKEISLLDQIAREVGALKRQRDSFHYDLFIAAGLNFVGNYVGNQQLYHLENCRTVYQEYSDDKYRISNKGFNKRLANENSLKFSEEVTNQILRAVNTKFSFLKKVLLSKTQKQLMKKLNVKDICAIDGSEITLREGTRDQFDNKGAGRNKKDGSPAAPALKIHALFSVCSQSFEVIDIT